jgi:hypothetical protein
VSYRNKTYVAFASENIRWYRLMEAWRDNDRIDFNFYDAHDLYIARDTSTPETIKGRLRERLKNAKQVVLLGSPEAKRKGGDGVSFLAHEVKVIREFDLPVVVANIDQMRTVVSGNIPSPFLIDKYCTISVSCQPKIIMKALDECIDIHARHQGEGSRFYPDATYKSLGI